MPITLNCPKCHKPFRVRDESIGGRVRCPSCGSVLQVPAALSPASNFDEPAKGDLPIGEGTQRPMAEDVPAGAHAGPLHEAIPPSTRRPDLPVAPGGTKLPGPPSIKSQAPGRQPPQLDRSSPPAQLPTMLPNTRTRGAVPGLISADAPGWRKVRGGLGMIRWALFLIVLVVLCTFGHGIWVMFDFDRATEPKPGLLGKEGWPMWKEILVAYTAGLLTPAALLLFVGRLRCGGAPPEAQARGLAQAAAFFTFLALAGVALFIGITYFGLADKFKLPSQVRLTSLYAAIPSAILADILTLLFIGQIGWPLSRPGLQRGVAGFFAYILLVPAAILIGELYYPVLHPILNSLEREGYPLGDPDSDLAQRATIWLVILLTAVVMLILRYAGVAGAGRRAIRKHLDASA